ncbi:MAG: OmpA family protein [Nitrospirae bacterium]|nr:OmpA family protein [Nitrospirota bacterium]
MNIGLDTERTQCYNSATMNRIRFALILLPLFALTNPPLAISQSVSPEGTRGVWHVQSADRLDLGRWVPSLTGGYFSQKDLVLAAQDHSAILGTAGFTFRPGDESAFRRTEASVVWEGRSYRVNDREVGSKDSVAAFGDPRLRLKWEWLRASPFHMGLGLEARAYSKEESGGMAFSTISPAASILNTLRWSPFAFHLTAGYRLDQSEKAFQSLSPYPSRTNRTAQGIRGDNVWLGGVALELTASRWIQPFVECTAEIDTDGKAFDSNGDRVKVTTSQNPIRLTPGARLQIASARVVLAGDLGILTARFPREETDVPQWTAGLSFQYVRTPRHREFAVVTGRVLDQQSLEPLTASSVLIEDESDERITLDVDPRTGEFRNDQVPPGPHRITAFRPAYKSKSYDLALEAKRQERVEIVLEPEEIVIPEEAPAAKEEEAPPPPLKVVLTKEKIVINQRIQFYFNSVDIKPVSMPIVHEVARIMSEHPEVRLEVQGHTDPTGAEDINELVSWARAEVVYHHMVLLGVDPARLTYKGYGTQRPIAPNESQEGRKLNRRVEFVVPTEGESALPAPPPSAPPTP